MNKLEKYIHDLLKKNQKLKNFVRNFYQSIFDIIPKNPIHSKYQLTINEGYFFGFHDISPFSHDDTYLLANKIYLDNKMPSGKEYLGIGLFKFPEYNEFIELDKTLVWNYHKGSRLQWIGKSNSIIYNYFQNGVKSKIFNTDSLESRIIDFPIDTVSPDGLYATSFSYERLNRYMPGYGYIFCDESFINEPAPTETGLFLIDITSGAKKVIISLRDLSEIESSKDMLECSHYLTHTSFSKDSKYIAFLHRWSINKDSLIHTRLITIDLEGKNIFISPTNGMVSHYAWNFDGAIIAYCRIDNLDSHYLFTDHTMKIYKKASSNKINSDGHQHFLNNSYSYITDTYPNRMRYAHLFLNDPMSSASTMLAKVYSPKKFQSPDFENHWACDLHPRCNYNNTLVCFDSAHTGKRAICLLNIKEAKIISNL